MFSHGALFGALIEQGSALHASACTGWNVLGRLARKAENSRQLSMLHYECRHSETDCSGECYGEYREPHVALLRLQAGALLVSRPPAPVMMIIGQ